jgi:uncharacterized protein (DUF849 family)
MSAFDPDFSTDRVIIFAAPNGARRSVADHAALPITPGDLADCAESLLEEQVSVLHLHVRDGAGRHSLDADHYRQAMAAIRERVGDSLVLQMTTESVDRYSRYEQMAAVRALRPEAVSLGLRELCPDAGAETDAADFFAWLNRERIWPQYILYSAEDLQRFDRLRRRGVFAEERPSCLLVLGRYSAGLEGSGDELDGLLAATDCRQFPWAVCCFGRHENAAVLAAAEAGGHVRIGFENNIVLCDGSPARDNAQLIAQFRRSAIHLRRRPATADEIRTQWQH